MSRQPAPPEQEAEALLRRKGPVRAQDLIRIIHEVNPTGRELPRDVQRRRYALKSKLQSVLVREFGEDVAVAAVPGEEGMVGLRYRPEDRDACHARLDELDDDARAALRLRLDLGEDPEPEATAPSLRDGNRGARATRPAAGGTGPRELLRQARAAVETFDYELARTRFEEALEASDGGEPEATALLEFLSDQLAAYEDALTVRHRLGRVALRSPGVRALLGFCAAQLGRTSDAEADLEGAEGTRAVEAWVVLARAALASGDVASAERQLQAARRLLPTHPELLLAQEELARSRAVARQPLEAALQALVERGDPSAEARAAELLQRWPDSALARRVVHEAEARRREQHISGLCTKAEAAFGQGDFAEAATLWRAATALGANGLLPRLTEALAREEERAGAERVEALVEELSATPTAEGLRRYLQLDPTARLRVKERAALPVLGWLDRLASQEPERAWPPLIAAALALTAALPLDPVAEPDRVLLLLEPHQQALRPLAIATELVDRARRELFRRSEVEARRALEAAGLALKAGQHAEAMRLANEAAAIGVLTVQPEALALRDQARQRQQDSARIAEYTSSVEAARYVEALAIARFGSGSDSTWVERRAQAATQLGREWRLEVCHCEGPVAGPDAIDNLIARDGAQLGLDPKGTSFSWVNSHGNWLFIRHMSLVGEPRQTLVSLRVPVPFAFPTVDVEGTSLFVTCEASVLELSTEDWSIRFWGSVRESARDGVLEESLRVPGTNLLWLHVRTPTPRGEGVLRIFDLETGRLQRQLPRGYMLELVRSPRGELRVFVPGYDGESRVFTPDGSLELELPSAVRSLVAAPSGEGYGALSMVDWESETLGVELLDRRGEVLASVVPPGLCGDQVYVLVPSTKARLLFVMNDTEAGCLLLALEREGRTFRQVWQLQVHSASGLAVDVSGTHVALTVPSESGYQVYLLGAEPPALPDAPKLPGRPPSTGGFKDCGFLDYDEELSRTVYHLSSAEPAEQTVQLAKLASERGTSAKLGLEFARALESHRFKDFGQAVREEALQKFPDDPYSLMARAELSAKAQEWGRVLDILGGLNPTGLDERALAHRHHQHAEALYHLGRLPEAVAEFGKAAAVADDPCHAAQWAHWLGHLAERLAGSKAPTDLALLRLLDAVLEADASLARQEGAKALALLDTQAGWADMEVQVAARLAEAALAQDVVEGERLFRKRLLLSSYVNLHVSDSQFKRSLALGPATWDEARLQEVLRRARDWLGEPAPGPTAPLERGLRKDPTLAW